MSRYHYGREEHHEDDDPEYWEQHTAAEWKRLADQAAALGTRVWNRSWRGEAARLERVYERSYSRYVRRCHAAQHALEAEMQHEHDEDRAEVPHEYPF